MTIDEASKQYNIPIRLLKLYESWGLCGAVKKVMGSWQYDERDLEYLSLIMTLHDIGFPAEEIEAYMRLLLSGNPADNGCLRILDAKRAEILDEIHFREKQLDHIDYLRYELRKKASCGKD